MKIQHYMTVDTGNGPTAFVTMDQIGRTRMLRFSYNACYDKAKEVDPDAAKSMLARYADLGSAHTAVPSANNEQLREAVLEWVATEKDAPNAIRWDENGSAIAFENDAAAYAYDLTKAEKQRNAPPPKRKRIMMD